MIQTALAGAKRILIDNVAWLVYELPPPAYDRRSTTSLVFETAFAMRRVRTFPSDWRTLTDGELLALSWTV